MVAASPNIAGGIAILSNKDSFHALPYVTEPAVVSAVHFAAASAGGWSAVAAGAIVGIAIKIFRTRVIDGC